MESHYDDNDIDPSNDEELPPGSSTKERKTSFTTAQVKELGQALEISQLHRSLENISTFLEKKLIEDSDDLEQSSDKEATSHSKRKAFDSTSKRPLKRRKSEQCNSATQTSEQCSSAKKKTERCGSDDLKESSNKETTSHSKRKAFDSKSKLPSKRRKSEQCNSATQKSEQCSSAKKKRQQCGSPFYPSVNDFLESSEDEDQTDDSTEDLDIPTSIFNDDECLGAEVSDALAKRINEAFSKKPIESKFKALAEKYCSPENCNLLTVPRVNPGIWNDLPRASRKLDVGLQEAQKSAVHAAQAITLAVESLIRCKKEKAELDRNYCSITCAISLSFIGNASFQVSLNAESS